MTETSTAVRAVACYTLIPKQFNCAQAVAKACERDDLVETLKGCGGGRAPEGLCGALYAAISILPEDKRDILKKRFEEKAGEQHCRPIRHVGKTSCSQCVRISAELLDDILAQEKESD